MQAVSTPLPARGGLKVSIGGAGNPSPNVSTPLPARGGLKVFDSHRNRRIL
ncbi:MAG: hypothetical protein ACYT04_41540 [Nostoc sp.]